MDGIPSETEKKYDAPQAAAKVSESRIIGPQLNSCIGTPVIADPKIDSPKATLAFTSTDMRRSDNVRRLPIGHVRKKESQA